MQATLSELLTLLSPRKADAHKGDFGHVLIIGGAPGMLGAVILAATAASCSGAGLVSVATHPDHAPLISAAQPNVMSHAVSNSCELQPLIDRASVLVVGPGLGQSAWSKKLFATAIKSSLPMIVDADALNLLAKKPFKKPNWIVTPHPGEAARLLQTDIAHVQKNRPAAALQLQQQYSGVAVLKGAGTIIQRDAEHAVTCTAGNPGMATGGMGDVLSGIIGGLVAQRLTLADAATLGVYLHAAAADVAAKELGMRGLLPQDLFSYVRMLIQ